MKKILLLLCISSFSFGQMTAWDYSKKGGSNHYNGNYKEAIQDFTKAIELDPKNYNSYRGRGWSSLALKDYRGAIQDYTRAIELKPENGDPYRGRGLAKVVLGDKDGGCLDWSKAGELGSESAYDFIKKFCN
jgi:tetratricopeptide (TPR) repeat protein